MNFFGSAIGQPQVQLHLGVNLTNAPMNWLSKTFCRSFEFRKYFVLLFCTENSKTQIVSIKLCSSVGDVRDELKRAVLAPKLHPFTRLGSIYCHHPVIYLPMYVSPSFCRSLAAPQNLIIIVQAHLFIAPQ